MLSTIFAVLTLAMTAPQPEVSGIVTLYVSPSVVATIITAGGDLQMLVLWRGTPGWRTAARAPHQESGGGSGGGSVHVNLIYGSVSLDLSFSPSTNVVRLRDTPTHVPDGTNVLFVDDVDGRNGPTLVRTMAFDVGGANIDPRRGSIAPLLSRSPDVVAYLRCDVAAPALPFPPGATDDLKRSVATQARGLCDQIGKP
ncbi:MAG TPA: hypothetical protein VGL62_12055 [Vicinamibacterales bacterium]